MNFLQHIYPGDAMASFLVRVLAEITLVMLVALLVPRLVVRRNPAFHHGVCVCALLCVLVAPITTFGLEKMGWSTFQIALEHERLSPVSSSATTISSQAAAESPSPFWTLERARGGASLLILVWFAGTGLLVFRLANGSRKVGRLRSSAREVEHPKLTAAMAELRRYENLPNAPILFSRKLHSPVVVGPRLTTVILPEKLLDQLDEQQLRCVLAHELTHVRQRDPLIGLIQRIVEASYWPHPLVHVLNRDLIRAREEVCDNVALHGTTAPQYANTLLTVALGTRNHRAIPGTVGLMTPRWRLEERVKGLLDPHRRLNTTMNLRHLALMTIVLAGGTTVIAGAHIVAAPNPPNLQDTVDLFTHYDAKSHSIVVTEKRAKHVNVKSAKSANEVRWVTAPKGARVIIRDVATTPRVSTVYYQDVTVSPARPAIAIVEPDISVTTGPAKLDRVKTDDYKFKPAQTAPVIVYDDTARISTVKDVAGRTEVVTADVAKGTVGQTVFVTTDAAKGTTAQTFSVGPDVAKGSSLTYSVNVADVAKSSSTSTVVLSGQATASADTVLSKPRIVLVKPTTTYAVRAGNSSDVNVYKVQSDDQVRTVFTTASPAKAVTPTTVYIQGGHIKIVGDNIKVVYVKATKHKAKSVKPQPKSK